MTEFTSIAYVSVANATASEFRSSAALPSLDGRLAVRCRLPMRPVAGRYPEPRDPRTSRPHLEQLRMKVLEGMSHPKLTRRTVGRRCKSLRFDDLQCRSADNAPFLEPWRGSQRSETMQRVLRRRLRP